MLLARDNEGFVSRRYILVEHPVGFWRSGWTAWLGLALLAPSLQAAPLPDTIEAMRYRAKVSIEKGQWVDAFDEFTRIPRTERTPADREKYLLCLRHVLQTRRLRDKPSQAVLNHLKPAQVLNTYRDVLDKLHYRHVDRDRANFTYLFRNGVQELRFALEDETFVREHLAEARPEALQVFRARLDGLYDNPPVIDNLKDAREQLQSVVLAGQGLGLKPAVVMVEFICGACHALDEYTLYLSPRQLVDLDTDLNGKYAGIGVDVGIVDGKLFITRVHRAGSAEQAMLTAGDAILRIDGQPIDPHLPALSVARLLGDEGTTVELEIQPVVPAGTAPLPVRIVKLERHPVYLPSSIETYFEKEHSGIGYIKLASFQKNTVQELKDAILQLQAQTLGLKALVLDLRGNPGGYFPAALQVAELFLHEGVIVYTQSRLREEAHRASNPNALTLPLVILVDGETASAAEVVAGAFKENGRATLVGQTTFGKCSIQCLVRLESIRSGLQITMARFSSPAHLGYDGRGVVPHRIVERSSGDPLDDLQREVAFQIAEQLVKLLPPR